MRAFCQRVCVMSGLLQDVSVRQSDVMPGHIGGCGELKYGAGGFLSFAV